jgi:RNA polymerase sigma-70 factor (ECF subfamily)
MALRELLVVRYADFKARLTRQFGSEDIAIESLHEAWIRLGREGSAGPIHSAPAYLLRTAANIALDLLRARHRRAPRSDIDALLQVVDPAPDPSQAAAARLEFEVVERAIRSLPPRARTILLASRLEGLTHQQVADRLGISRRLVLYDLKRAIELLDAALANHRPAGCAERAQEST